MNLTTMDAPIRNIKGKVHVSYGTEEKPSTLNYDYKNTENINNKNFLTEQTLFNNNHVTKVKAFTLEGGEDNKLSFGRQLIDRNIVGYWSSSLSSSVLGKIKGYEFENEINIRVDFAPRKVKTWDVFGDISLQEYPINFDLKLYVKDKKNPIIKTTEDNMEVDRTVIFENAIENVVAVEMIIHSWNKPHKMAKIYRFYDSFIEIYKGNQLKDFEVVEELANCNGEVRYGVVSNSMTATLLNDEKRKFDLGRLASQVQLNKRIMPYISYLEPITITEDNKEKTKLKSVDYKMGTYYIKEWEISQDKFWVNVKANDKLLDFQKITYWGRKPNNKNPEAFKYNDNNGTSFYELFMDVLECANKRFVIKLKGLVDKDLKKYYVQEPYIGKITCWEALDMLCNASLSHVYLDRDNNFIVSSDLTRNSMPKPQFNKNGELVVDKDNPIINSSNCFDYNLPYYENCVVSSVDIAYFTRKKEKLETILTFQLNSENNNNEIIFDLNENYVKYELVGDAKLLKYYKFENYKLTLIPINITITRNYEVKAEKLSFEKHNLNNIQVKKHNKDNYDSNLYKHVASKLITNEAQARDLANKILEIYGELNGKKEITWYGGKFLTTNWRGNPKMDIRKNFTGADRFFIMGNEKAKSHVENYECVGLATTFDGGLKQLVKGISHK